MNVLITGSNSYIGNAVRDYLLNEPDKYSVTVKGTIGWKPEADDFKGFDVVFNVAGIAHVKETDANRNLYYEINRDLAIRIAECAKKAGVRQFVLLSSMSVYGMLSGHITKKTVPNPVSAYGKSKLEADEAISKISKDSNGRFSFACLRPPMVYGKGCKGNYQLLKRFALRFPFFPNYDNQRSMIYIGNLCEFIKDVIDEGKNGMFFPQNEEYVNTSKLVALVAANNGKRINLTKAFNWAIKVLKLNIIKKVFGNLTYESCDLVGKYSFEESVRLTEE